MVLETSQRCCQQNILGQICQKVGTQTDVVVLWPFYWFYTALRGSARSMYLFNVFPHFSTNGRQQSGVKQSVEAAQRQ